MFVIIILIIDSVAAAYFAKEYVKRNRGLMLDMPDWSLIPDMTVILFQFILSGFLLGSFYLRKYENDKTYLYSLSVICIFCIICTAARINVVRNLIKSFILKKTVFAAETNSRKNRNSNEEEDNKKKIIHDKRLNDAVAYAEYTLLYTIRYSLEFLLAETILYFVLQFSSSSEEVPGKIQLLHIIQNDLKAIHVLHVVLILEIAGVCLTIVRIFAVVQYVEKKPARKPLEQIRDYLRSEEIKN